MENKISYNEWIKKGIVNIQQMIQVLYNYYNNERTCQIIQRMLLKLFYNWLDKKLPTIWNLLGWKWWEYTTKNAYIDTIKCLYTKLFHWSHSAIIGGVGLLQQRLWQTRLCLVFCWALSIWPCSFSIYDSCCLQVLLMVL